MISLALSCNKVGHSDIKDALFAMFHHTVFFRITTSQKLITTFQYIAIHADKKHLLSTQEEVGLKGRFTECHSTYYEVGYEAGDILLAPHNHMDALSLLSHRCLVSHF